MMPQITQMVQEIGAFAAFCGVLFVAWTLAMPR